MQRCLDMTNLVLTRRLRPCHGYRQGNRNDDEHLHSGLLGHTLIKSKGEARRYAKLLPYLLRVLHHGRSTRVFEDQVPLSLVLKEKDLLLTFWAVGVGNGFDEPSSLLIVKSNVSVDGFRKAYTNPLAAGDLRKGIDNLLRERLKEDRPRA